MLHLLTRFLPTPCDFEFDCNDLDLRIETEEDLKLYLSNDNNIIVSFGQRILFMQRDSIEEDIMDEENIFVDKKNIYYCIFGRYLINEKDIDDFLNKDYSIYNVSTLNDIVDVVNKSTGKEERRSVYELVSYEKNEL